MKRLRRCPAEVCLQTARGMRTIRDALRLRADGRTLREIGESLGLGRTTIGDHLQRAARAGLAWPLDAVMMIIAATAGTTRGIVRTA